MKPDVFATTSAAESSKPAVSLLTRIAPNPQYGADVQAAVKACDKYSAETRARAARLSEWVTFGAGMPAFGHGGGSPDGARLVVRALTPVDRYAEFARKIAGNHRRGP